MVFPTSKINVFRSLYRIIGYALVSCIGVFAFLSEALATPKPEDFHEDMLYDISSPEGNYLAAYIASLQKDMKSAAFFYQLVLAENPKDTDIRTKTFYATLAGGDLDKAFDIAKTLLPKKGSARTKNGSSSIAQFVLAIRDIQNKRYASARTALKAGISGPQMDLSSVLLTAWTYAGSKDIRSSEKTLNLIEARSPLAVVRDYHLGLIKGISGNKNEAVIHLQSAYRVDRSSLKIIDAYARALSQQGNTSRAIEVYEQFDRQNPGHPLVTEALEKLRANEVLPLIIKTSQQGAAEVLYAQGIGNAGRNQPGGELSSILYLRLAHYLDPKDAITTLTLTNILTRIKQYDLAIDTLSEVPETSPLRTEADIEIGYSLANADRKDEATEYFQKLSHKKSDDIPTLTALGDVLKNQEKWPEAIEAYSKAVNLIKVPETKHWLLFYNRGIAYERNNEWEKAESDLEKALQLVPVSYAPGRASILNYLGYSWVDRGENIDAAFKMLQEAVSLSPRDGAIIDSLAWAYYRLGRYDEAVRELERAIELKPGDPVLNDHLGDAYWKVDRKDEARFQWQHSLDSQPEPKDLALTKKKLEVGLEEALSQAENEKKSSPTGTPQPVENKEEDQQKL